MFVSVANGVGGSGVRLPGEGEPQRKRSGRLIGLALSYRHAMTIAERADLDVSNRTYSVISRHQKVFSCRAWPPLYPEQSWHFVDSWDQWSSIWTASTYSKEVSCCDRDPPLTCKGTWQESALPPEGCCFRIIGMRGGKITWSLQESIQISKRG